MFSSLRGYRRAWLRGDLVAGLTVWAVLVPEALAYATIAGVSPVVGLYAAPAALLLYAAVRQLAAPGRRADVGHRGPVGGRRRRAGRPGAAAAFAALHRRAGDHHRRHRRSSPGCCGSGFLANFISEPVLKGFIIGLALTIIVGQLPKLFGDREGRAATSSSSSGTCSRSLGDTNGLTLAVGLLSLALVLGLRRFAPVVPGVAGRGRARRRRRQAVRPRRPRRRRSSATSTAGCPPSGCPTCAGCTTTATLAPAARRRSCWSASPRASARPRPTPPASTTRSTPTASCSGSARPTSAPACPAAWSSTAACPRPRSTAPPARDRSSRGWSCAALTVVTLLFLTGLFEELPEATLAAVVIAAVIELVDVPALRRALPRLHRARLGRALRRRRPARLHRRGRRAARRAGLRHAARACSSASPSRCCCCSTAPRGRTSPCSAGPRHAPTSTATSRATPTTQPPPGIAVLRVEGGLFFANADARPRERSARTPREPARTAVVLDAETIAVVDVTAAQMLADLADDLERDGVELAARARHRPGPRRAATARPPGPGRLQRVTRRCRPRSTRSRPPGVSTRGRPSAGARLTRRGDERSPAPP